MKLGIFTILALGKLVQKDCHEFKARLDHTPRSCFFKDYAILNRRKSEFNNLGVHK